jgi:hypothetical protein
MVQALGVVLSAGRVKHLFVGVGDEFQSNFAVGRARRGGWRRRRKGTTMTTTAKDADPD